MEQKGDGAAEAERNRQERAVSMGASDPTSTTTAAGLTAEQQQANAAAVAVAQRMTNASQDSAAGMASLNQRYFQPSKIMYKPVVVYGFEEGHEYCCLNGLEAEAIRYDTELRLFECRISHPQAPGEMASATQMLAATNIQAIHCCEQCGKREHAGKILEASGRWKLLRCGKCKTAMYCGRDCQKAAWKNHKLRCKSLQAAAGSWSPELPPNPENCPICFVTQMNTTTGPHMNATMMECCSKKLCCSCLELVPFEAGCPFCRQPFSTSDQQTVDLLRKRAAAGDADAQFNLAGCYDAGKYGVTRDFAKAAQLYRSAAEQGHGRAAMNLAVSYREGEGVPVDKAEMVSLKTLVQRWCCPCSIECWCMTCMQVRWYKVAADEGHAAAQCNLGLCYGRGDGVAQDIMLGVTLLIKAAKQGDPIAISSLAQNGIIGPDFAIPQQ